MIRDGIFRKAGASETDGCVEVAADPGGVRVRDSKDQAGPELAFTDHEKLTATLHHESVAAGVPAGAAGHHAGECETSIMLALRPHAVRDDALAAGLAAPTLGAQAVFYPSLRANVPSGTVGDPRAADAARGERYLTVWTALLLETYRREKKSS